MTRFSGQKGFSLLEILVAFSILALSLGFLLNIFSKGVHTAGLSEDYTSAVQIAESLLVGVGVESELTEGESNGTEYEKYYWTITSYPYDVYAEHNLGAVKKSPFKKLRETIIFQVVVRVAWGDESDENQRFVELNTLKYGSNKL
jgi:general secretion pathway protein I